MLPREGFYAGGWATIDARSKQPREMTFAITIPIVHFSSMFKKPFGERWLWHSGRVTAYPDVASFKSRYGSIADLPMGDIRRELSAGTAN